MILKKHWFKIISFFVFLAIIIRVEVDKEIKSVIDLEMQLREDYIKRIESVIDSTEQYLLKTDRQIVLLKDQQTKNDSLLQLQGYNLIQSHNKYLKLKNDVAKIKDYSIVQDSVLLKRIQPNNKPNK